MNDTSASSSQENLLSQETMDSLYAMISGPGKSVFNDLKNPDWSSLIDVSEPAALPPVFNACSSIPDTSNWPGEYSFKVSFDNQEKNKSTKHMNWTYSETDNKLYVKKDAFCPFNFSTDRIMPAGCAVRAMVVYTAPEHNSQVVTRCLNHSRPEIEQGVFEAEHLIRSESSLATYHNDIETQRHSIVVPFENPPAGQDFSVYIFKFLCFSSCAGGPNRRLLTLIFTLEHGGKVLGRQSVDLKICACPGRDRESAEKEKQSEPSTSKPTMKIKAPEHITSGPSTKKLKSECKKKNKFLINADDKECFEYLVKMKHLYKVHQYMQKVNTLPPDLKAMICVFRSSSSDDSDRS